MPGRELATLKAGCVPDNRPTAVLRHTTDPTHRALGDVMRSGQSSTADRDDVSEADPALATLREPIGYWSRSA